MVYVPPVGAAIELVAHELEHVLERARGQDFAAESRRRDSGVWRAFDGFESQRAIDMGRQVAREVEASRVAERASLPTGRQCQGSSLGRFLRRDPSRWRVRRIIRLRIREWRSRPGSRDGNARWS
jgi:hypothetical protein